MIRIKRKILLIIYSFTPSDMNFQTILKCFWQKKSQKAGLLEPVLSQVRFNSCILFFYCTARNAFFIDHAEHWIVSSNFYTKALFIHHV